LPIGWAALKFGLGTLLAAAVAALLTRIPRSATFSGQA
jgi:hypothetical protein